MTHAAAVIEQQKLDVIEVEIGHDPTRPGNFVLFTPMFVLPEPVPLQLTEDELDARAADRAMEDPRRHSLEDIKKEFGL